MTATIRPFPTANQTEEPDFWGIVHDAAMIRLRHQALKAEAQRFAEGVLDYAATMGDAYLKQEASRWLEALGKTR
jgi:hypothetical protein